MKILQRTYNETKKIDCPYCNSLLEYDKNDIHYGAMGCPYIVCPVCNEEIDELNGEEDMIITSDNIIYPQHFYHFGNGVKISDEEIQKFVKKVYSELENTEEKTDYYLTGTGNTIVIGTKNMENEITIYVCKNYEEFSRIV